MSAFVDVVKNAVPTAAAVGSNGSIIEEDETQPICPSLSWKQRLIGCGVCMGIGSLLSLLSFGAILRSDVATFAVVYTLGNVASIGGTLFLAGPKTQVQRMFSEGRWVATTVFVIAMGLTLLAALLLSSALLVLLLCLVQFGAMAWYMMSYIPFARTAVKGCLRGVV
ncbi:Got1/Sft2-like family, putative [Trypanosoma equiperdum]|uniref:Vesicle transport protein n=3 Tax=Trypanozoon TaxID=39700 RepID=Q57XS6_TRYB2|nr:hypothetical protein, conserved [Trypanosoma brucei gambiense DAL972]XP_846326.1 hypothetical protein, conserved [Trypanosoma brucei brucei TREU927]AAX69593.1 hypothetical protein, conserved [Trypanosoma brucei]SCU64531.1 Got1/Sft2-like family, putative [Trypanosoma equiperdum]AAZ12767.1 hypothetical protein, conserved [Trypanosoma brucei brucei TREU927]CBH12976.1 hypothetical protein, conserved [Trypanosoma brucei gambiense DAL972]|eukprot:XP_011775255.1 hypothetical protein, conserved [Trypanosoma brucei gambiense DAL972]